MRVLFCSYAYPPDRGGVAAFSYDLVGLLRGSGYEVRVLHELGYRKEEGMCPRVAPLMARFRRGRIAIPFRFIHFLCAVNRLRPRLVICSSWGQYGLPAVLFARRFGYKVIIQAHGTEIVGRYKQGWPHRILRYVLNAADLLWPNSRFTKNILVSYGCSPTKIQIVHPFLSDELVQAARSLQGVPREEPPLLLTAGHLYPQKGIDIALHGLSMLRDLKWSYAIAGEEVQPGYRRQCELLTKELGLANRVKFLGQLSRQQLWREMARSSMFILVSRPLESFGIVYIEAQALGAPCVAADVGGVPEAVGDGGVLVPPEDPQALARVLRAWLTDPKRIALYRQKGYARVMSAFTAQARRAEILPTIEALMRDDHDE